jgi:lysophospholipase L1-like esterase
LEDYGGAMENFFAALLRTANRQPGAVTRVSHFGDSPLTGDLISGEARARFQRLYGDAGHGFLMAGKPWEWYGHLGSFFESGGWRIASPFVVPQVSGPCGMGGAGFTASSPGAHSAWGSAKQGLGAAVSRFEVHFLARPRGGTLLASLDGGPAVEISTAATAREAKVHLLRTPDGPHRLTVHPKGDGEVVLFGAAMEREGPGVVYDSLGANGASIHGLSLVEEGPWVQDLGLRRPDLVILQYGTNESSYAGTYSASYRKDYREILRRVRRAVPGVSILVMAPMDRGERNELGEIVTAPGIPRIVEVQRAIAREEGCAFFDTFQAMGGEGTMARWYEREHPLVSGDLTHPSRAGSDIVARALVDAVEEAFHAWVAGSEAAPPPTTSPPANSPD